MKKLICLMCVAMLWVAPSAFAVGYYEFSTFDTDWSDAAYDVGTYGNDIYYGDGTHVYKTTVSIADMTKVDEPQFLADGVTPNPNYQARSFTDPTSLYLSGYGGYLNSGGYGEMYIDDTSIYTLGTNNYSLAYYDFNDYSFNNYPNNGIDMNEIVQFDKVSGNYIDTVVSTPVGGTIAGTGWGYFTLLANGGGKWWVGNEERNVYSIAPGDMDWTYEFTWSDMAGTHGDGMEYVNGYLFVSDMTSNYIGQWGYGDNPDTAAVETGWTEWNRFAYEELGSGNKYVEGMGFGALNHFWAGDGEVIYELGGGEIQQYVDDGGDDNGPPPVPEPGTLFLLGTGLSGLALARRRKSA